jgi:hypothetical protein
LNTVYVAAFGNDCTKSYCGSEANCKLEGKEVCTSNGWIPAMYAAQPTLESKVEGWYFHPYGPASGAEFGDSYGIQSVPEVRKKMTSGENNIIVSEVGYCAQELGSCNPPEVETSPQAATLLTEMLDHALPYYEEGWLKALLVYSTRCRWMDHAGKRHAERQPADRTGSGARQFRVFIATYCLFERVRYQWLRCTERSVSRRGRR